MVALIKFFSWFHAAIPAGLSDAFGCGFGRALYLVLRGKRKLTRDALTRSFPDWPPSKVHRCAREVFIQNGRFLAEVLRLHGRPASSPLDQIHVDAADIAFFNEVMAEGKGALALSAHVNNYIYLAAWAARLYPMTVVVKKLQPESLNRYVTKVWESLGIHLLPHHGTYRSILKAVRAGGVIGFIMDQNTVHSRGVFVTFFGQPASTTPGLAMLSAQSGSPVIPIFLLREGMSYRLKFMPAIEPPPDREIETLQRYAQRYTNAIEQVVREQPESWIWMHKRWKTQPRTGDKITHPDGSVHVH